MKHRFIVMDASNTSIRLETRDPATTAGNNDAVWMQVPVNEAVRAQLRALLREFENEVGSGAPCALLTDRCSTPGQACQDCAIERQNYLRDMPIIRSTVRKSEDGEYIIQQTTITSVKPLAYYEAVTGDR